MKNSGLNYRLVIFMLATLFGVLFTLPTLLQTQKGAKVTLGLDLQGGLYMLLGVKTDEAIVSKMKSITGSIKYFTDKNKILIRNLKPDGQFITFNLLDSDKESSLDEMLKKIDGLIVEKQSLNYKLVLSDIQKEATKVSAVSQAVETIRNRLNQFGLAEPTVAKQGKDNILVEIPGIKTLEEEIRARELIGKAAHLQMMAVDEDRNHKANVMSQEEARAYGSIILSDSKSSSFKYVLKEIPILDGSMINNAKAVIDENGRPAISFSLNSQGGEIFADFTGNNIGKRLAIVLDNVVYSAPNIQGRIGDGSGQITGRFSAEEVADLVIVLKSGSLLAPVVMLEKRSIGPSLGADSVKSSVVTLIISFFLVVLFMIFYYRRAGIIASIALFGNLGILVAMIAILGATLTLPGMAGIILTVAMGIDANVIINERIRELLRAGVGIRRSIEQGYDNAMSAIIDSNLTTIIVSVVLYIYGTGPIKGFAVTLSLGVFISMLTAILGTRGVYIFLLNKIEKSKDTNLWFGMSKEKE